MRAERFELMEAAGAAAATTRSSSRRSRWKRPRIRSSSTAMQKRAHQGRARRRRSRDARRAEGRLQGLQLQRREPGRAAAGVPGTTASTCSARSSSGCRATGRQRSTLTADAGASARRSRFAQFVMLTPFPGTRRLRGLGEVDGIGSDAIDGIPLTRHWLIPRRCSPRSTCRTRSCRPTTSGRARRACGISSTAWRNVWARAHCVRVAQVARRVRADLEAVLGRCAPTRASRPTARGSTGRRRGRAWIAKPCQKLFAGKPMPELQVPRGITPEVRVGVGVQPSADSHAAGYANSSDGSPTSLGPPHRIGGATVLENRRAGADVLGALPPALQRLGWDATVALPRYRGSLGRRARRGVSRHGRRLHARGRLLRGAAGRRCAGAFSSTVRTCTTAPASTRSTTSTIPTTRVDLRSGARRARIRRTARAPGRRSSTRTTGRPVSRRSICRSLYASHPVLGGTPERLHHSQPRLSGSFESGLAAASRSADGNSSRSTAWSSTDASAF